MPHYLLVFANPLFKSHFGIKTLLIIGSALFLISTSAFAQKVKPVELIVECIEYVGNGTYKANFGYDNPNKKNFSVPAQNSVVTYNYGQAKKYAVNTFVPGRQYNVFSQEFNKNDKCEWILVLPDGTTKIKSSSINSVHCPTTGIEPYYDPTSKVNDLIGSELTSLFNNRRSESDSIFQISQQ
jgi:hypothetical protein